MNTLIFKRVHYLRFLLGLLSIVIIYSCNSSDKKPPRKFGTRIDNLNGVSVYYNGSIGNVKGRNKTSDGYNLGLKYQCVEFVKRYYYEYLDHRMPNTYGNAKDFFNKGLKDGQRNKDRNLSQYTNPSLKIPRINDLVIFSGTVFNKYGHVAIISNVTNHEIEIIQQNPGPFSGSREKFKLLKKNNKWKIDSDRIMGWLRKE
ncbi:CHAP domain-containing protein [Flavobacterium sandaracinum]|uniref:CHAP domain-containing protein n=1 Tax=Flavobacterium sandaracinum TaxID=2541733 RepID=A0A4R5CY92_9FLAO|nr:CHAP domain-containing protein [Flavobacterium sandaracinum]TDE05829.1 CHAP domain-containing protein [Flavobacterium sandaracinum]